MANTPVPPKDAFESVEVRRCRLPHLINIMYVCRCGQVNVIEGYSFVRADGATTDCCQCGETVIIKSRQVYPLHEWLNLLDPRWPADGKNTGYIEV